MKGYSREDIKRILGSSWPTIDPNHETGNQMRKRISRSEYENGLSNSKVQIRQYVNNNETGQNHALTGQILATSVAYSFTIDDQGGIAEDVVFEFSSNNPLILDPNTEYIIELVTPNNIEIHYDDNINFYPLGRAYDIGGTNSSINKDIPFEARYTSTINPPTFIDIESKIDAFGTIDAFILDPIDSIETTTGNDSTIVSIDVNAAGVNAGSLDKILLEKYKEPCPEALVESAKIGRASCRERV